MLPDAKVKCPYTGFTKSCRAIVAKHDCPKFIHILGQNPNTGEQIDRHGCADTFVHMLMIENTRAQAQTGAALESFRNNLVDAVQNRDVARLKPAGSANVIQPRN